MQDRINFRFWDTKARVMLDWDCICQTAFNCTREEGDKIQRYGLMYGVFTTPSRFIPLQCTGLKETIKWCNLSLKEKQDFYNQVCSEDDETIKYHKIEYVEHLWKPKLIFEGDILKVNTGSRDTSGYGIVEYAQHGCNFVVNGFLENPSGFYPRRKGEFFLPLQEGLRTKIIGNIYENPELLEANQC